MKKIDESALKELDNNFVYKSYQKRKLKKECFYLVGTVLLFVIYITKVHSGDILVRAVPFITIPGIGILLWSICHTLFQNTIFYGIVTAASRDGKKIFVTDGEKTYRCRDLLEKAYGSAAFCSMDEIKPVVCGETVIVINSGFGNISVRPDFFTKNNTDFRQINYIARKTR